jgi:hypothetical protein
MRNVLRRDLTNLTFLERFVRTFIFLALERSSWISFTREPRLADSVSTFVSVRDMDELDFHNFAALHC